MNYGSVLDANYAKFSDDEKLNYGLKIALSRLQTELNRAWYQEPKDFAPKGPESIYKNKLPSYADIAGYYLIDPFCTVNGSANTSVITDVTVGDILNNSSNASGWGFGDTNGSKDFYNTSGNQSVRNNSTNITNTSIPQQGLSYRMFTRYRYWENGLTGKNSNTDGTAGSSSGGTNTNKTEPENAILSYVGNNLSSTRTWKAYDDNLGKGNSEDQFFTKLTTYSSPIKIIHPDNINTNDYTDITKAHPFLEIYIQVPTVSTRQGADTANTSGTGNNANGTDNIGFFNPILRQSLGDVEGYKYVIRGWAGSIAKWGDLTIESGATNNTNILYFLNNPGFILCYGVKDIVNGLNLSYKYPPLISFLRYTGETFSDGIISQGDTLPAVEVSNDKDLFINTIENTIHRLTINDSGDKEWVGIGGSVISQGDTLPIVEVSNDKDLFINTSDNTIHRLDDDNGTKTWVGIGGGGGAGGELLSVSKSMKILVSQQNVISCKNVTAWSGHVLVILETGRVMSCGDNEYSQLGFIPDPPYTNTPIGALEKKLVSMRNSEGWRKYIGSNATAVGAGDRYSVVLLNTGEVVACGRNYWGNLGDGTGSERETLVSMDIPYGSSYTGSNAIAISVGDSHSVVLLNTGEVMACGRNDSGQLGIGNTSTQNILVSMVIPSGSSYTGSNAVAISAGSNTTAILLNTGEVMICGRNNYGQLGIGSNGDGTNSSKLVSMHSSGNYDKTNAVAISCGGNHTAVLLNTGQVMVCGHNEYGQLGIGNTNNQNTLVSMDFSDLDDKTYAIVISCSGVHTAILLNTGEVMTCGWNEWGQLGDGTSDYGAIKTQLVSMKTPNGSPYTGSNAVAISCANYNTVVLLNTGEVMICGSEWRGILGIDTNPLEPRAHKSTLVSMHDNDPYEKNILIMTDTDSAFYSIDIPFTSLNCNDITTKSNVEIKGDLNVLGTVTANGELLTGGRDSSTGSIRNIYSQILDISSNSFNSEVVEIIDLNEHKLVDTVYQVNNDTKQLIIDYRFFVSFKERNTEFVSGNSGIEFGVDALFEIYLKLKVNEDEEILENTRQYIHLSLNEKYVVFKTILNISDENEIKNIIKSQQGLPFEICIVSKSLRSFKLHQTQNNISRTDNLKIFSIGTQDNENNNKNNIKNYYANNNVKNTTVQLNSANSYQITEEILIEHAINSNITELDIHYRPYIHFDFSTTINGFNFPQIPVVIKYDIQINIGDGYQSIGHDLKRIEYFDNYVDFFIKKKYSDPQLINSLSIRIILTSILNNNIKIHKTNKESKLEVISYGSFDKNVKSNQVLEYITSNLNGSTVEPNNRSDINIKNIEKVEHIKYSQNDFNSINFNTDHGWTKFEVISKYKPPVNTKKIILKYGLFLTYFNDFTDGIRGNNNNQGYIEWGYTIDDIILPMTLRRDFIDLTENYCFNETIIDLGTSDDISSNKFFSWTYPKTIKIYARCIINNNNYTVIANKSQVNNILKEPYFEIICIGDYLEQSNTLVSSSTTSDDRNKHNEQNITNALNIIEKLQPKKYIKTQILFDKNHNFKLNKDGKPINFNEYYETETGLIAQDIYNIPELKYLVGGYELDSSGALIEDKYNSLTLRYNDIFVYSIQAIKELKQENDILKNKLSALENKIKILEEKIN